MSHLRALLATRLQLLWNLARRGRGALGTVASVVIVALALACLVPPFLMFQTFGNVLGQDLSAEASPAMTWLSGLHALVVFGLGGMAGMRHQTAFDRSLLRLFPLRSVQLLLAELPFSLLDTIPVLGITLFVGLGAGLVRTLPGEWPHAVLAVLQGMLGLVLVQQLVGAGRRLVARSRVTLLAVGLVLAVGGAFAVLSAGQGLDRAFALIVDWLPTTAGYHGLRAAARGEGGRAVVLQLAGLAWTGALFAVTAWTRFKELDLDPPLQVVDRRGEGTWTFKDPASGVARLFVSQVWGTRVGKLVLVLPVFCSLIFVLAADILRRSAVGRDPSGLQLTAQTLFERATSLPLYLIVPVAVVLFDRELWMNQFGWDGQGVKTLFLLPIQTSVMLRGKLVGLLRLVLPQALVACLPLLRLHLPDPLELATGLVAAAALAVGLGLLGQALSPRFPRKIGGKDEKTESAPASLTLASSAGVVAGAALAFGVVKGLAPVAPWAPTVAFAALTMILAVVHRALVPRLGRDVDDCRELIVETLG